MFRKSFISLTVFAIAQALCLGQGVIGGNQNGLGPGGYLPKPGIQFPAQPLCVSLATPGYEFDLITSGSGFTQVLVDPTGPVVVPLVKTASLGKLIAPEPLVPISPGFLATFSLANNSAANRVFTFPFQYWADNKIVFSIFDGNNALLWQSVPLPVDIPPLAQPVNLTLNTKSSWVKTAFIPLDPGSTLLPDGQYVLQATLSGTPEFSASAAFEVKNIQAGPIVVGPVLLGTGISGLALVGPVTPVSLAGTPNVNPLAGAIIQVVEKRRMGVYYINPPFSTQAVADANGKFSVAVPPGAYIVTGLPPQPGAIWPKGETETVQVANGHFTNIVVNYDSGIR